MKPIAPDDIRVGMKVTFAHPRKYQAQSGGFNFLTGDVSVAATETRFDRSYVGDVFDVEAIDLPMVVLRPVVTKFGHKPGAWGSGPMSFHTGEYRLYTVSDEYIAALMKGAKP